MTMSIRKQWLRQGASAFCAVLVSFSLISLDEVSAADAKPSSRRNAMDRQQPDQAVDADAVHVMVVRQGGGEEIRYRYTVSNLHDQAVVVLMIGVDFEVGEPELKRLPKGWTREKSSFFEYGWKIDPAVATAGNGKWIPLLMFFEEHNEFAVTWVVERLLEPGISRGESAVFEINIGAGEDPAYETAPWTAIFADGRMVTGTISARSRR